MTLKGVVVMTLRVMVTVALLALILQMVGAEGVLERFEQANPVLLVLAFAVSVVQLLVVVWRWQVVIKLLSGIAVGLVPLTLGMGRSMLLSQPLPSTVGGDVVRVLLLSPRLGLAMATRSVVCDRVLGLAALAALVAAILPFFAYRVDGGIAFAAVAGASIAGLVAAGILIATPRIVLRAPLVGRYAATLGTDFRMVLTAGGRSVLSVGLAVSNHLLGVAVTYLLAQAVNAPLAPLTCLLIVPPALLISSIPISLGGWGVREGALAAGFALVGGDVSGAVAVSVLLGLLNPVMGAAVELVVPLAVRCVDLARRRA